MSGHRAILRRQFYDDLWSTPLGELCRRYGVSHKGLAIICRRHDIPRPPVGYWSKKRAGWADPVPPLPPAEDPRQDLVTLAEPAEEDKQRLGRSARHAVDDEVNRCIEQELAAPPIVVPRRLRDAHRLIAAVIEDHERHLAHERRQKRSPGTYLSFEAVPQVRANVSTHSQEIQDRALRIMDAFFKALEERGYEIAGPPEKYGGTTFVNVLGLKFDVRIYEPCRREVHLLTPDEQRRKKEFGFPIRPTYDKVPTGRLCLEFRDGGAYSVLAHRKDGEHVRLENTLNDLIVAVLRKVDEHRQAERERERREAAQREAEALRRQKEERQRQAALEREREEARVQALLAEVKRWRDSQEIRAYLEDVRRVIAAEGIEVAPGSATGRRIAWISSVADRLDPLRLLEPTDPSSDPPVQQGLSCA